MTKITWVCNQHVRPLPKSLSLRPVRFKSANNLATHQVILLQLGQLQLNIQSRPPSYPIIMFRRDGQRLPGPFVDQVCSMSQLA